MLGPELQHSHTYACIHTPCGEQIGDINVLSHTLKILTHIKDINAFLHRYTHTHTTKQSSAANAKGDSIDIHTPKL